MSIVTMNMSDYRTERDDSMEAEYDDEVLCVGWNPSLALQQHAYTERGQPAAMPPELTAVDVELFLKKMYAYQR
ncbi:MAG: hypothetical protein EPN14_05090 [Gallionella sp.]|nr:MAG: hypothetical protein EPN14_05090 [Gallionella sp.]